MGLDINLLFTELFSRYGLKFNEGTEVQLHIKLPAQLEVGRFLALRPRLSDQDLLFDYSRHSGFHSLFYHSGVVRLTLAQS